MNQAPTQSENDAGYDARERRSRRRSGYNWVPEPGTRAGAGREPGIGLQVKPVVDYRKSAGSTGRTGARPSR